MIIVKTILTLPRRAAHLTRPVAPLGVSQRDRYLAPAQMPATPAVILLAGAGDVDGLGAVGGRDRLPALGVPYASR